MDIAEKTLLLKKDLDDVYNKALDVGRQEGYESGYSVGKVDGRNEGYTDGYSQSESYFWDSVLDKGNRDEFVSAFAYWNCEYIRPSYKVISTSIISQMFRNNSLLRKIESEYFDLSKATTSETSSSGGNYFVFSHCKSLEEIEDIGMKSGYYYNTFSNCPKLKKIAVVRSTAITTWNSPFFNDISLEEITIEGEIGKNFDIHYSPLSTASIVSIIEHLSDTSGATLTLNTNAVNSMVFPYTSPYTNITYNSWDELIATKTNWTISKASA